MERYIILIAALSMILFSCSKPLSEQIEGMYSGQYTNNAFVGNGTATIVTNGDNAADVTISADGFNNIYVVNVALTQSDGDIALYRTNFLDVLSGAYSDGELSLAYSYLGGAVTFVGSK